MEDFHSFLIAANISESAKAGLQLNIKKTKIMTTKELQNFNVDNEEIEIMKDCVYLGSSHHSE